MQYRRIAVVSGVAALLLLVDALSILLLVDAEHGLHGPGVAGAGMGAVLTTLLALALVDGAAKQWDVPDGVARRYLMGTALGGLVWGCVRVGLGDPWIIPATIAMCWLFIQAALFVEAEDDGDEEDESTAG